MNKFTIVKPSKCQVTVSKNVSQFIYASKSFCICWRYSCINWTITKSM